VPGAKQVFREYVAGNMRGDVIARAKEELAGTPLLVPYVHCGALVREEPLGQMREHARAELLALPRGLRRFDGAGRAYPVRYSERCRAALDAGPSSGAVPQR
jgi:hypothetical protein